MPLFGTIVDLNSSAKAAGTALANITDIAGAYKTYLTLAEFQGTASFAPDRFSNGQIIYISASNELFKVDSVFNTSSFSSEIVSQSFTWPGGGGSTPTGSLLTTASSLDNVITFTKGDNSTFSITIATGSGGGGGVQFPFSGSAQITGSLGLTGSLRVDIADGNGSNTKFAINSEGVAVLADLNTTPTAVTGGIYYSSSQFYFGVD
tara:strand:- start:2272 stop:2889 length:618 start_codon:yes stop_codon:yes gene_type:complete